MNTKKIWNIVFYKYYKNGKEVRKSCIFYRDGSVVNTTYEDGLNACETIVKERKISSKNAFKEMINRDIVHVMSGEELKANFQKFVCHNVITQDIIDEAINEHMNNIEEVKIYEPKNKKEHNTGFVVIPTVDKEEKERFEEKATEEVKPDIVADYTDNTKEPVKETKNEEYHYEEPARRQPEKKGFFNRIGTRISALALAALVGLGVYSCAKKQTLRGEMLSSNIINNDAIPKDYVDKIFKEQNAEEKNNSEAEVEIENQQSEERTVVETPAVSPVVTPENSNTETQNTTNTQENTNGIQTFYNHATNSVLVIGNNDYYDDYTYEELLAVTTNETQKRAMQNIYTAINAYNIGFADAYVEEGKDIRAALSFDELVALQQAYNDYTKEQIRAIFNGAEIDASKMTMDYKAATLQLMGAHIIENSEHPVDMSMLLETQEGKDFYRRYHKMFLAAKEAQNEDQKLKLVKAFYDAIRADFPITDAVRTEGIMHADAYAELESYKLSVIPMIAASEMLFQNLKVDYTLNDSEVNFLNDAGLCNRAFNKFEKIQTITLNCCKEDNTNPLYEQYRNAIIKELKAKNRYVIDDAHRDLSQLEAFKRAIGSRKRYKQYVGGFYEIVETHTEVKTWTETETTTWTETERIEAEIPEEEKQKIDEELEKENEKAREEAEKKAEEEQKRLQEEADKEAEKIKEEVKEFEEDLQEKIDEANQQIEMNQDEDPTNDKPVNEEDFGEHNVDFYDEYEDGNGNLEDYVEEITTDPTGDQTGQPLPDPQETGRAFDAKAEGLNIQTEITIEDNTTEASKENWVEYTERTTETETSYENPVTESESPSSNEDFWIEFDMPEYESYTETSGSIDETHTAIVESYEAPYEVSEIPGYERTYELHETPVESYEAPAESYVAPEPAYEAPAPAYEAPAQDFWVEYPTNSDIVDSYIDAMVAAANDAETTNEYTM